MEIIKPGTKIDFIGKRKLFLTISGVLVSISIILLFTVGLNYGIDFAGGTEITIRFLPDKLGGKTPAIDEVREALKHLKDLNVNVQEFGDMPGEYLIKMESITYLTKEKEQKIRELLKKRFGEEKLKQFLVSTGGGDKIEFVLTKDAYTPPSNEPKQEPEKAEQPTKEAKPETDSNQNANQPTEQPQKTENKQTNTQDQDKPNPQDQTKTADESSNQEQKTTQSATTKTKATKHEELEKRLAQKLEYPKDAVPKEEIKKLFREAGAPAFDVVIMPSAYENAYRYVVTLEGIYDRIKEALDAKFGAGTHELLKLDKVGPRVGEKLKQDGILAVIYALIGILIYVALRFEFKFAPGAVLALVHDVLITIGVLAALQLDFNLTTIAALLTIVGYSLNDTIVVYDRIRENYGLLKRMSIEEVFNKSINETLSRTILTSLTTFITVFIIWLLTVGDIKNFAFAMLIGVIVGTYSSIFIASPLVIYIYKWSKVREDAALAAKRKK